MQPVDFNGSNKILRVPKNWDEDKYGICGDLFVEYYNGVYRSCWKLSFKELIKLIWKRKVYLYVASGFNNPAPVALETD